MVASRIIGKFKIRWYFLLLHCKTASFCVFTGSSCSVCWGRRGHNLLNHGHWRNPNWKSKLEDHNSHDPTLSPSCVSGYFFDWQTHTVFIDIKVNTVYEAFASTITCCKVEHLQDSEVSTSSNHLFSTPLRENPEQTISHCRFGGTCSWYLPPRSVTRSLLVSWPTLPSMTFVNIAWLKPNTWSCPSAAQRGRRRQEHVTALRRSQDIMASLQPWRNSGDTF